LRRAPSLPAPLAFPTRRSSDLWITDKLYTLDELCFWLEETGFMPPASWKKTRRKSPIGLGRNCALFESARTWAYREIRHHFGDPDGLGRSIQATAQALNQ